MVRSEGLANIAKDRLLAILGNSGPATNTTRDVRKKAMREYKASHDHLLITYTHINLAFCSLVAMNIKFVPVVNFS